MNSSLASNAGRWLRPQNAVRYPAARIVCLPHAGGTAGYFRGLGAVLVPDIEVLAAQYPGRQDRLAEPMVHDLRGYARAVVAAVGQLDAVPLALFGHSMGALIAYEMAARYRSQLPDLTAVFVSAQRPPTNVRTGDYGLTDDAKIIEYVSALGGPGAPLFASPDFAELILPSVRNDLRAVANHRQQPADPIGCQIVALAGEQDPGTAGVELDGWAELSAEGCRAVRFPGDHFYLDDAVSEVAALVRKVFLGWPD